MEVRGESPRTEAAGEMFDGLRLGLRVYLGGGNGKRGDLDARVQGGGMPRFCNSGRASQKDGEKRRQKQEGASI